MKKLLFLLLISAANMGGSIAQTTSKITQTRDLTEFTFINLEIPATVYVTQESRFNVQVSATQDVLDLINTEVSEQTLYITWDDSKDWKKKQGDVIITISLPKPNGLYLGSSGSIKAQNNFLTDYLSLEVHGSGDIVMKDFKAKKVDAGIYGSGNIIQGNGVAEGIVEEVHGSGTIKAQSLMCTLLSLSTAGSGDLNVSQINCEKLMATIVGSGNVVLGKGTAGNVLMESSGSGNIVAGDVVGTMVMAKVAGSGNISIGVLDALDASVAGSGNVNYRGNPGSISKNVNGSGSVRQM